MGRMQKKNAAGGISRWFKGRTPSTGLTSRSAEDSATAMVRLLHSVKGRSSRLPKARNSCSASNTDGVRSQRKNNEPIFLGALTQKPPESTSRPSRQQPYAMGRRNLRAAADEWFRRRSDPAMAPKPMSLRADAPQSPPATTCTPRH